MENMIVELLRANPKNGYLFRLAKLRPEFKGNKDMFMPMGSRMNQNVLICSGVNDEFIDAYIKLRESNKITMEKVYSYWELVYNNLPCVMSCPIATKRMAYGNKKCWLPIKIKLTSRWN